MNLAVCMILGESSMDSLTIQLQNELDTANELDNHLVTTINGSPKKSRGPVSLESDSSDDESTVSLRVQRLLRRLHKEGLNVSQYIYQSMII